MMIDMLIEIGISNAIFSFLIAIVAIIVGKWTNRPRLAHLLWLLVLVKLLMPSLLTIPGLSDPLSLFQTQPANVENFAITTETQQAANTQAIEDNSYTFVAYAQTYLPMIWGLGILFALVWSVVRIVKFNRLLKISSEVAPDSVYKIAEDVSDKLNLKKVPLIKTTSAEISPMVWWIGGTIQVFVPFVLIEKMDTENLRLVLAHELAHVQRKDYLVRWVECLTAILFWWNPVVWLAQKNLRAYEEICCDAQILTILKPKPHQYATSLLDAVESFAGSALRLPSMASKINSGGNLLRRINMILSNQHSRIPSRKFQFLGIFFAALILPFGFVNAQEIGSSQNLKEVETQLKTAVEAGEMTPEQAKVRMAEYKLKMAEKKIESAVAAGKITPEQGKVKLKGYKLNLEAYKIKAAVASGEMTKEEAKAKISANRMYMAKFKIKSAVDSGQITPEQGKKKLKMYKLKMKATELKQAVKEGKLSEEEAKAKYKEIKLQMKELETEN